jgi:hypothetical protein
MVLAPRLTTRLSACFSGRVLLTAGLAVAVIGNLLFWGVARAQLPYSIFVLSMLVAGAGAGLLNGQTVKVLGGAIPSERAGMASGLASTTRFIGILISVAAMGAILSSVVDHNFKAAAMHVGLDPAIMQQAVKRVASGDLAGALDEQISSQVRETLEIAGIAAFANGFAAATLFAAILGLVACILTFRLVGAADTAPTGPLPERKERPCKLIDCRDPL